MIAGLTAGRIHIRPAEHPTDRQLLHLSCHNAGHGHADHLLLQLLYLCCQGLLVQTSLSGNGGIEPGVAALTFAIGFLIRKTLGIEM